MVGTIKQGARKGKFLMGCLFISRGVAEGLPLRMAHLHIQGATFTLVLSFA
jgi:hypothetical protein